MADTYDGRTEAEWIAELKTADVAGRCAAALALAEIGPQKQPVMDALLHAMLDPDKAVQVAAMCAIGFVRVPDSARRRLLGDLCGAHDRSRHAVVDLLRAASGPDAASKLAGAMSRPAWLDGPEDAIAEGDAPEDRSPSGLTFSPFAADEEQTPDISVSPRRRPLAKGKIVLGAMAMAAVGLGLVIWAIASRRSADPVPPAEQPKVAKQRPKISKQRRDEIVAQIEAAGGKVTDVQQDLDNITKIFGAGPDTKQLRDITGKPGELRVSLPGGPALEKLGPQLGELADIRSIDFSAPDTLTDAEAVHLEKLKAVQVLSLGRSKVTDAGLKHLAGLSQLTELSLAQTEIDGSGLAHLANLKELSRLFLDGSKIKGESLKHVKQFPKLTLLGLPNTAVANADLAALSDSTSLETLVLYNTPVTDEGLAALKKLTKLKSLTYTIKSDEGLKNVAQLTQIGEYSLEGPAVTDAGLAAITGARRLYAIHLTKTAATENGIKDFQLRYPSVTVHRH